MEAASQPVQKNLRQFQPASEGGLVRESVEPQGSPILLPRTRLHQFGDQLPALSVGSAGCSVRIPASDSSGASAAEITYRSSAEYDRDAAGLVSPELVAYNGRDANFSTPDFTERTVDNPGPVGLAHLGGEVVHDRRSFIRKFALREGISEEVLARGWASLKKGYIRKYDPHFTRFAEWWEQHQRDGRFSPNSIRAGQLASFLQHENARGLRHASLKDACAAVSVACLEAFDMKINLGSHRCIATLMKDVRIKEPPRGRKYDVWTQGVGDVVLLLQEAFAYGPNEALGLGHLKEKLLVCLMVDTAARPSDLHRLYRILSGRNSQIRFFDRDGKKGMEIRYFWSKEVDPFSSRRNSTGVWFSSWVTVFCSNPTIVCSHCIMKYFLDATEDPELIATTRVPELGIEVRPLFWAKISRGVLQHCSVDHISKVVKARLATVGLGHMHCQNIRGASTSKIVQCAPHLRPNVLKLGRWTSDSTFHDSYETEIDRVPSLDDEDDASCQQVLRWGFNPTLPLGVSQEDYARPPGHWVGQVTNRVGKVVSFDSGVYKVANGRTFFHWELMQSM